MNWSSESIIFYFSQITYHLVSIKFWPLSAGKFTEPTWKREEMIKENFLSMPLICWSPFKVLSNGTQAAQVLTLWDCPCLFMHPLATADCQKEATVWCRELLAGESSIWMAKVQSRKGLGRCPITPNCTGRNSPRNKPQNAKVAAVVKSGLDHRTEGERKSQWKLWSRDGHHFIPGNRG